jgi:Gram-negative bacterial TonB protein C-terminal
MGKADIKGVFPVTVLVRWPRFFRMEDLLNSKFSSFVLLIGLSPSLLAQSQVPSSPAVTPHAQSPAPQKVPSGVLLVKGAWSSSSDSATPLPEGGSVANNIYTNQYFGLSYPLSPDWYEKYKGPPPSDSGYYVLAQLRPTEAGKGPTKGSILVAAQDLFFALVPAANAKELIRYTNDNLKPDYKVEEEPSEVKIADHSFVSFEYVAPAADLHWYILATEIRCHMVQFIFTSGDTQLLKNLVRDMNKMKLPMEADPVSGAGGGDSPVCIKDYATDENMTNRVDPVLGERRFNPIPVRIIIDKGGNVKNVHFLSAFPEQSKTIQDALLQWKFKPYLQNGQPVEVETGILFGHSSQTPAKTRVTN